VSLRYCRRELPGQKLADEPTAAVHDRDVAGPDDDPEHGGQEVGPGLRGRRPVRVRPGGGRELLPRVFRDARPQVRDAGGATAAVRRQSQGVAVARQPVRDGVRGRFHGPLRGADDVRATRQERRGRPVQHVGDPTAVHAPAAGHHGRALCVRGPREPARPGDDAPERVAHVGQQPPDYRPGRALRAQLRAGGRHAHETGRTAARGTLHNIYNIHDTLFIYLFIY